MRKKENVEGSAGDAISAAGLKHIVQEAGDISGVAHADAEALLGSVQGLEDGGSLVVLLEVAGGTIVQVQDDAAAAS
jgi:hypothetical protein